MEIEKEIRLREMGAEKEQERKKYERISAYRN